jgi:hypothetical protein
MPAFSRYNSAGRWGQDQPADASRSPVPPAEARGYVAPIEDRPFNETRVAGRVTSWPSAFLRRVA